MIEQIATMYDGQKVIFHLTTSNNYSHNGFFYHFIPLTPWESPDKLESAGGSCVVIVPESKPSESSRGVDTFVSALALA